MYFCCKSTYLFWKLPLFLVTIWLYHFPWFMTFFKVHLFWIIEAIEWTNYVRLATNILASGNFESSIVAPPFCFLWRLWTPWLIRSTVKIHRSIGLLSSRYRMCFCVKIPLKIQGPFVTRKYEPWSQNSVKLVLLTPMLPKAFWNHGTRTRMTNVMYLVKLFSVGLQGKKQDTLFRSGSELANEAEEVRHYC